MTAVTQLGYLGLTTKDPAQWESYATRTLGFEALRADPDGALRLRMDAYHHRFAIHEGAEDTLAYTGWEVADAAALATMAGRLEAAGYPVTAGTPEQCEKRRAAGLISFADPDGYATEIYWGPAETEASRAGGFVTGDQGLGHILVMCNDLDRSMDFYTSLLGMKTSDYVAIGKARAGFLHCNPRHHSIAFVQPPGGAPRSINHFMVQREALDDVGRRYDEVQKEKIPLITTLGRHSNDLMLSFYMRNPSGWGVEYGWGGREIDDSTWCVEHLDSGSLWGHQPVRASQEGA
ncbi:MAG: VOC family protein [Dehalococcoidia bacterium]